MASHYNVPGWAGKAPVGLHLDVMKGEKLAQKLMVDEKRCYLFGRNPQLNDFCIDHASCSRVHSALVWHKHLNRAFLVDLGSTHGTYIGTMRIESNKPIQLPIDSAFHFGASTRIYMLRERPQQANKPVMEELELTGDETDGALLGLPETETELDNLTEFNTAHNRRVVMLGIGEDDFKPATRRRSKRGVHFNEEEEVINPEDVDPSVGRFRNLVSTTIIPVKRARADPAPTSASAPARHQRPLAGEAGSLYGDLPPADQAGGGASPAAAAAAAAHHAFSFSLGSKLGIGVNPAPEVEERAEPEVVPAPAAGGAMVGPQDNPAAHEPRKKKYAKEMWPGKKTAPALLV